MGWVVGGGVFFEEVASQVMPPPITTSPAIPAAPATNTVRREMPVVGCLDGGGIGGVPIG